MDSAWAHKQRARRVWTLVTIVAVSFVVYASITLYRPPSCFDHKQDQGEVGPDCGGPCSLLCTSQTQPMSIAWAHAFEVSKGWWSALAYVENPNFDAQVKTAQYRLSVYDKAGALLIAREGQTFIYREPVIPIFEGRLPISTGTPYRVVLEWLNAPLAWTTTPTAYSVSFEKQRVLDTKVGNDVEVTIKNNEPFPLKNVGVVAIVYDASQEPMAASETFVDMLGARAQRKLNFSWPEPFPNKVGRVELLPQVPQQE